MGKREGGMIHVVPALGLTVIAAVAAAQTVTFDDQKAGEAPKGMTCALTGKGKAGTWILRAEADAPGNKVEKGKRTDLKPVGAGIAAYGKKAKVPLGAWSELRVTVDGHAFDVALNGEALFRVEDATFVAPGRVGVWTKADSVTYFDDLEVKTK